MNIQIISEDGTFTDDKTGERRDYTSYSLVLNELEIPIKIKDKVGKQLIDIALRKDQSSIA